MTYRLHPEAALRHEKQVAYYEERSTGLGRRYDAATMQAIGKAIAVPHQYKVIRPPDLRKVRWRGFPFASARCVCSVKSLSVCYRNVGGRQTLAVLARTAKAATARCRLRRQPGLQEAQKLVSLGADEQLRGLP